MESAARLLSACLISSATAYPTDQFDATAADGALERFYDKREAVAAVPPPAWHCASPQEVLITHHVSRTALLQRYYVLMISTRWLRAYSRQSGTVFCQRQPPGCRNPTTQAAGPFSLLLTAHAGSCVTGQSRSVGTNAVEPALNAQFHIFNLSLAIFCPAQLEFAGGLIEEHLAGAASQLVNLAADPNTPAAWLERRGAVRSLVWRLEGVLSGTRACLADFDIEGEEFTWNALGLKALASGVDTESGEVASVAAGGVAA